MKTAIVAYLLCLIQAPLVERTQIGLPDPKLYPVETIAKLATKDAFDRPRAIVEGRVKRVSKEDDGDIHFVVVDAQGVQLICEIIPELALAHPKIDAVIEVWGVYRWDLKHNWGELHPVIGWKVK